MPSFAEYAAGSPGVEEIEEKVNVLAIADAQMTAFQKKNAAIDKLNKQITSKPRTAYARCLNTGCNAPIPTRFAVGRQMACPDCRCVNWPTGKEARCRLIRRVGEGTGKPEPFCSSCFDDPETQHQVDSEDESDEEFEEEEGSTIDTEEDDSVMDVDEGDDEGITTRGKILRDEWKDEPRCFHG